MKVVEWGSKVPVEKDIRDLVFGVVQGSDGYSEGQLEALKGQVARLTIIVAILTHHVGEAAAAEVLDSLSGTYSAASKGANGS